MQKHREYLMKYLVILFRTYSSGNIILRVINGKLNFQFSICRIALDYDDLLSPPIDPQYLKSILN